jgi:hypothetical protein
MKYGSLFSLSSVVDKVHDRNFLQDILEVISSAGDLHLDLGLLMGTSLGPKVSVPSLLDIVAAHDEPEIKLSWDEGPSIDVQKTDGGVLGTLEVKF